MAVDAPPPVDLRDVTARLSALGEPYVLAYFWLMVRRDADRPALLEQLTHVTIQRPSTWDQAAIRREHDAGIATFGLSGLERACFACRSASRRLYVHHVIEIQHGGSNDPKNRVALCFPCHQYLHPWLETEPAPRHVRGFEAVRSIAPRAVNQLVK